MSIPFVGLFTRLGGLLPAIGREIKLLNFKGVKRITVKFDPFHENAATARDFLFAISTQRVQLTNPSCIIKTEILSNREKPVVEFLLTPTVQEASKLKSIKVEADKLSYLELLQVTNEQVTARAPKEEAVKTLKTKSEKKSAAGGKRR